MIFRILLTVCAALSFSAQAYDFTKDVTFKCPSNKGEDLIIIRTGDELKISKHHVAYKPTFNITSSDKNVIHASFNSDLEHYKFGKTKEFIRVKLTELSFELIEINMATLSQGGELLHVSTQRLHSEKSTHPACTIIQL